VLLTRVDNGELVAIIHDGYLQHLRVAADSAIGTAAMSRPESATLAMLGSGGMARAHVEALAGVRPLRRLRVHSPTPAHREAFAADMRAAHGLEVEVFDTPEAACRDADILASCTDSVAPVIRAEWLEPGMHVISIGGRPHDEARARIDRKLRLGTSPAPLGRPELGTADEYLGYVARPGDPSWKGRKTGKRAEAVTGGHADEVAFADVASGRKPGRTNADEITYSERGNVQGVQFYAVAAVVYEAARDRGLGREIPTDWFLQDIRD
jgi:ornithine cyclodeaminase/alanine dehydrogenase-like protein (mu-crystallin family)